MELGRSVAFSLLLVVLLLVLTAPTALADIEVGDCPPNSDVEIEVTAPVVGTVHVCGNLP